MLLISSLKKQISTDGAFTSGEPTQKVCLKLDVSGQSDQEVDVWGHLRDFPAETCVVGSSGLPDFHYALLETRAAGPGKHVVCSPELWVC